MKLKLFVLLFVALFYMTVTVVHKASSSTIPLAGLTHNGSLPDGTTPPHAVDTAGNPIPEESTKMPDKPIILAKDSADKRWGEHKPGAEFDHVKHTTDIKHSLDGKTLIACVECHHTEQPGPVAGQPYLKKFVRKEVLTEKQLAASNQPVKSCRACHFQPTADETDEFPPQSITYPKEMNRQESGRLYNQQAYHINCILCHEAAKKRDPQLTAPVDCDQCHVDKKKT